MRDRIIDCQTGTRAWREYTKEEEVARRAEEARFEEMEQQEKTARTKETLLGAMANLKQAEALEKEGVFTSEDVGDCRQRVEELKTEMRALTRRT